MEINSKKIVLDIIKRQYLNAENNNKILNITYGTDKNYLFGVGISMVSVLLNNPDIKPIFHVFTDHIDNDFIQKSDQLAQQFKTNITIYQIDSNQLKQLPYTKTWSYAMYFRLIAFDYLSDSFNTCLYLDSDVICKGSLKAIQQLDLGDNYAAVIPDVEFQQKSAYKRLEIAELEGNYFNSGVIYANLIQWKANNFMTKAFNFLADKNIFPKLSFLDQDILNILFVNHVVFLSKEYNSTYNLKSEVVHKGSDYYKNTIKDSTVLIHYTAFTKPWYDWAVNYPSAQFFKIAYQQSPWKDAPLISATTPRQYKDRSKHEIAQGKLVKGIISHIQYIWVKLKKNKV